MTLSRLLLIVKLGIDVLLSDHLQSRCIDSLMYRYTPTEYWMDTAMLKLFCFPYTLCSHFCLQVFLPHFLNFLCGVLHFPNLQCPFVSPFFGLKYNKHEKNYIAIKVSRIICIPLNGAWTLNIFNDINCSLRERFKGDFKV